MYRSHWNETEFEVSNILNMIKCFTNHLSRSKVIIVDSWYRYVFSYQCIYGFKCLSEHAQKERYTPCGVQPNWLSCKS
jgi:hypothetical protein